MKHHFAEPGRYLRQGFPEAIYGTGKTIEQIVSISKELSKGKGPVIITRTDENTFDELKEVFPNAKYSKIAKLIIVKERAGLLKKKATMRYICVVTAGTSDIGVAEEAAITAETLGNRVERIYDVGVSGVHRLLKNGKKLSGCSCAIVCAGMEGALASVVGGIVRCPVIGIPTSVGYGVSFSGLSALFTMLNSCAANVSVVNIDDGFGGGVIASLINQNG